MRAVISRVTEASVTVDGEVVGALPRPGLLVLLGVAGDDDQRDVATMVRKIAELRILRDEVGAVDAGAPVLVVSQFTLLGSTAKGRRPRGPGPPAPRPPSPWSGRWSTGCGTGVSRWPPASSAP